jgi:probable F420-dependent oxidoreductase
MIVSRIRIGVQIQPQHADYPRIRDAVIRAEEMGIDVIYNWDHFFPLWGDPDGMHYECWSMLGSMAEITSRAEIGPLVLCNSYRNPELVADMARTMDHISSGRFILAIGAGWFRRDYDAYGYEFGTAGQRLRDLAAALPRITERMSKLNPQPLRKIPILIGGGGEKMTLRLAAEYADIWHGFGDADTLRHKNAVLDEWCARIGRDPSEIERSIGASVETSVAEGDVLVEAGARQITFGVGGPDYDLSPLIPWLAWRGERNACSTSRDDSQPL